MTEPKPTKVKKPKRPFTGITPLYEPLLQAIYQFHMLRAEQQCRLLGYSPRSEKRVQALDKDLVDHRYLQEEWPPTRKLRSKYVYVLGEEGIAYLKERDYDISNSLRASQELGKDYAHITHLLELNDVLISAVLLKQHAPLCYLECFIHDRELKRRPCTVTWHGKKLDIIPDAFLDVRVSLPDGKKRRLPILLEHDRNSEFGEGFRKKVRGLIALVKSEAYKDRFGVNAITIAFTTFTGDQRRDRMREVVRQELGSDLKTLGHLFVFTSQQQPPDPKHLWLNPCWYTPFMDDKPVAILAGD
jgi:hypothetical protein